MKMAGLSICFLVLSILLVQVAYCQPNFEAGYVISLAGDTIHGMIDNRNKEKNPIAIVFREELNGQQFSFKPNEIRRFRVHNELYEGAVVTIDDSPMKDDRLTYSKEFHPRTDTVFLRVLIDGEKSLFYYQDEEGRVHLFIRQGNTLERLIYKKYLVLEDGQRKIKTNKSFLSQLSLYLQACSSVQMKISEVQYNSRDLLDIFQYYYECTDGRVEFQQKKENVLTQFGVMAGATATKLQFSSRKYHNSENAHLTNVDLARSADFTGGLYLNFVLPRNQRKWSFNNELLFNAYEIQSEYHERSDYEETKANVRLDYAYIKLNNLVRFTYPVQNLFFYLNAGVSHGIAVKEVNTMEKEKKVFSQVSVYNTKAVQYTTKLEQGIMLGLGSQYGRYSLEARYEGGTGMSKTMGLVSSTKRLYFLIGYRLF